MTQYNSFELSIKSYQASSAPAGTTGEGMDLVEMVLKTKLGETEVSDFVPYIRNHVYPHKHKHPFNSERKAMKTLFGKDVPWRELYDAMGNEIDILLKRMKDLRDGQTHSLSDNTTA